jgi:hypothetical protein
VQSATERKEQEMKWFGAAITSLFSLAGIAGYALIGYMLFVAARWALSLL